MLQVITRAESGKLVPINFDTNACSVIDGALIVYSQGGGFPLAGFAQGEWATFDIFTGSHED